MMTEQVLVSTPKTTAGANWLKTYLHPPSGALNVEGVPDMSVQSAACLNWKNEFSIDAPAGVGTGTWSALLLSTNNPQVPLLQFKWIGDLPATQADLLIKDYQNPNFSWGAESVAWRDAAAMFRPYASSVTVYFDASDLYNQGKCYVAQTAVELPSVVSGATPDSQVGQRLSLNYLPLSASALMQMSDKYYTGMAKDGSYSSLGFLNPEMMYEEALPRAVFIRYGFTLANGTTVPGSPNLDLGFGTIAPFYQGFTVSYHLYKGLLPQATLQVKRIHGWEIVPTPLSPWNPFVTAGPCPDIGAMEAAAIKRYADRDGYPSSANDLGSFLGLATKIAPILGGVWNVAKPVLQKGLGLLPGIGSILNPVIDKVEELVIEKTPKRKKQPQSRPKAVKMVIEKESGFRQPPIAQLQRPQGVSDSKWKKMRAAYNLEKKLLQRGSGSNPFR